MRVILRRSHLALAKARWVSWPSIRRMARLLAWTIDRPADDRAGQDEARVERRKRDRDLLLDVVDAKALERPAGDRDVAVAVDPLDIDEVAQHVVAADVVAAGDGLVGGGAERAGNAPVGIELELAIGLEIAAEIAPLVGIDRIGIGVVDPAVSGEQRRPG